VGRWGKVFKEGVGIEPNSGEGMFWDISPISGTSRAPSENVSAKGQIRRLLRADGFGPLLWPTASACNGLAFYRNATGTASNFRSEPMPWNSNSAAITLGWQSPFRNKFVDSWTG